LSKIHKFTAANYVQQLAKMTIPLPSIALSKRTRTCWWSVPPWGEAAHMLAEERLKMANEMRDFYRTNKQ
jgi:hypothetical protein